MAFGSILFPGEAPPLERDEPDFFADLNLDQVLASMLAGREQYALEAFFYTSSADVAVVRYRHEMLRDLERPEVLEPITRFAAQMRRTRAHQAQVEKLHHPLQKQAWLRDAIEIYCECVHSLAEALTERDVTSRGLRDLRNHVAAYAVSDRFSALAAETQALKEALAGVRYAVRIHGPRVTVSRHEDEPDYSAEVEETFARFKQGAVRSYLVKLPDYDEMNHVEAQILDRVARLHPDVFGALADYCGRHRNYLDATIGRFDREVQFYIAYLDLIAPLRAAGLPFCYPELSARSEQVYADDAFDIALANALVPRGGAVVGNDFRLSESERILVVTGPNNGGKTTFARTFAQLHHLAGLGLLVPGSEAQLLLPDRIHTHFEREESVETLRGKFEDELVRVHEMLEHATPSSILVMNESFSSTTLSDALFVGTEVMTQMLELGALGVYVTFVDELASLTEATVSMVAQIVPDDPSERTFKVIRQEADGLAYAWAIAERHGLTYERLLERIAA